MNMFDRMITTFIFWQTMRPQERAPATVQRFETMSRVLFESLLRRSIGHSDADASGCTMFWKHSLLLSRTLIPSLCIHRCLRVALLKIICSPPSYLLAFAYSYLLAFAYSISVSHVHLH